MKIEYDEKDDALDYDVEAKKFETFSGYKLPNEYLEFLKTNGTGLFPEPGFYDGGSEIGTFYAFCVNENSTDIHNILYANKILQADGRLTKNVLAFAASSDWHSIFCLVLDGELKGKVLLLGDDNFLLEDGYKSTDIDEKEDILEHNFTDFIDKLTD